MRAFKKELFIGAANGIALAFAIGLIAFAWKQSVLLGVVAGSATLLNQMIGAVAGVAIPFVLKRFHIDPALASSEREERHECGPASDRLLKKAHDHRRT